MRNLLFPLVAALLGMLATFLLNFLFRPQSATDPGAFELLMFLTSLSLPGGGLLFYGHIDLTAPVPDTLSQLVRVWARPAPASFAASLSVIVSMLLIAHFALGLPLFGPLLPYAIGGLALSAGALLAWIVVTLLLGSVGGTPRELALLPNAAQSTNVLLGAIWGLRAALTKHRWITAVMFLLLVIIVAAWIGYFRIYPSLHPR